MQWIVKLSSVPQLALCIPHSSALTAVLSVEPLRFLPQCQPASRLCILEVGRPHLPAVMIVCNLTVETHGGRDVQPLSQIWQTCPLPRTRPAHYPVLSATCKVHLLVPYTSSHLQPIPNKVALVAFLNIITVKLTTLQMARSKG